MVFIRRASFKGHRHGAPRTRSFPPLTPTQLPALPYTFPLPRLSEGLSCLTILWRPARRQRGGGGLGPTSEDSTLGLRCGMRQRRWAGAQTPTGRSVPRVAAGLRARVAGPGGQARSASIWPQLMGHRPGARGAQGTGPPGYSRRPQRWRSSARKPRLREGRPSPCITTGRPGWSEK